MKKILFCIISIVLFFNLITYAQVPKEIVELSKKLDNHSLMVCKGKKITFQDEHGIEPLLIQIEKKGLKKAIVIDKIVGKAAALLMVYGKVKLVYTNIIAIDAIRVLDKYNVEYYANEVVEYIQNKTKDGLCPMEEKVKNIDTPEEAYKIFSTKKQFDIK